MNNYCKIGLEIRVRKWWIFAFLFAAMMKFSYLCIVNENDGMNAAGTENYRPGQAENSPWAGRKNEVLSATRDNKPMFN